MPAKGQTCQTCNAICCHRIIAYGYTPEARKRHELAAKIAATKGERYYSTKGIMIYSHRELLSFGMVEIRYPDVGKRCPSLSEESKCLKEHHKPRLCRSYWCHGKLWKPKEINHAIAKTA